MNKLFNKEYLNETLMGPNAVLLLEELLESISIKPKIRILDLGCGAALTSILLASKYDVDVYATDLWVSATDNYKRVVEYNLSNRVIPIHADANNLPFANEFFDMIISIDSFHYYGSDNDYLNKLLPLLKKDSVIAVIVPGLQEQCNNVIPKEFNKYVDPGVSFNFYSASWWKNKFEKAKMINNVSVKEMNSHKQAWTDWLETNNPYAINDREMMMHENGDFFNTVQIIGYKK